ncbi:hypothetical protein WA026_017948 [Henosepilachna vigintioctopunctata]|uniref:Uncharacterized protein n=1 Tax=Henosepilachna vigintioctopunctata TaxID=420089 RepID=A0AAW1TXC5_9CUCU
MENIAKMIKTTIENPMNVLKPGNVEIVSGLTSCVLFLGTAIGLGAMFFGGENLNFGYGKFKKSNPDDNIEKM